MTERKLIVTADDFGLAEGINTGIVDAHQRGIVTRTSIIANGDAFDHAVALATQHKDLKIGIHLTLIGERPLNKPDNVRSLVSSNARMLENYKNFIARYILRKIHVNDVYCEFEAQIQKVLNAGLTINHIDSHQHLHLLPGLFRTTLRLAGKYNIHKIRTVQNSITSARCFKEFILTICTKFNRETFLRSHVLSSDYFFGLKQSGRLSENDILTLLDNMKEGTTEMMCHPGFIDKAYNNKYNNWKYKPEDEQNALISANIREIIKKRGTYVLFLEAC